LTALLCAGSTACADALRDGLKPVRLVYFWPVQGFLLIPIVVAQKHGIYARYGLSVSIELPPDAQTTARMLAAGQADIAMAPRTARAEDLSAAKSVHALRRALHAASVV
jgi:ABC-type nitrate/sulfonate/bicarbonate transport system substrate-binding protein